VHHAVRCIRQRAPGWSPAAVVVPTPPAAVIPAGVPAAPQAVVPPRRPPPAVVLVPQRLRGRQVRRRYPRRLRLLVRQQPGSEKTATLSAQWHCTSVPCLFSQDHGCATCELRGRGCLRQNSAQQLTQPGHKDLTHHMTGTATYQTCGA